MTQIYSPHLLEQAIARNFLIVSSEASLSEVIHSIERSQQSSVLLEELSGSCVSCVLVMAEDRLVGIVPPSDLLRLMATGLNIGETKVATIMTRPVVTMPLKDFQDVVTPLNLLRQHHFSHLPLLDEQNYPIGLVTVESLLQLENLAIQELQQKQTQQIEYQSLLTKIAKNIQSSLDLQKILDTTVEEVRQFLQTDRVIAYRFEPDWSGVVVAESVRECDSLLGRVLVDPHFGETMVEPYRNGRIQVTDNIYSGLTSCHTEFLEQIQVQAIIVVPILQGEELWGLLAAQECLQPRCWERSSVALLQQLATHISIAIQQANTMAQVQKLNQELEARVLERTKALTNSENRLNLIVSNILDGILVLDRDGQIVFANPSAAKILGKQIEQLMGLPIGVPNVLNDQFEISLLKHESKIRESEIQVVSVEWNEHPAYLMSLHDITERKQAEAKLLKSQADLAEAQQIAHVGNWELDLATQKVSWSDEIFHIFGLTPNQIELTHENRRQYLQSHVSDTLNLLVDRALQFGEPYETDLEIVRADGSTGYIFAKGTPKYDLQGKMTHLFGIVMDISDRKQAEIQLQRANEELGRATRLKDEFLANMSHELRTPLNAILGMTEALQEEVFGEVNDKQRKSLQTIERSGNHLLSLINDILDLAKIESGKIELDCTPTSIESLCQASLVFIKQQAFKKQIQLEVKVPPHLPEILVDERRIRQALINLLNNAVKFTPNDGKITLEVSYQTLDPEIKNTDLLSRDYIHIAVIDTGIGISPKNMKKLFQPFVQIDSALNRQYSGTGLGLSLVKRIVELHGGKVGLTSDVGVGSCFTIELPCDRVVASSAQAEIPTLSASGIESDPSQSKDRAPYSILLAEDNEATIGTISSYLEAKGYCIFLAENGQEAIDLAKKHHPDLILMDVQMPVMDGLDATKQIRNDPNLMDIPIIALTALAMPGDREKCLAAGANEYLTKPVKLKQLANVMQQLLAVKDENT